MTDPDALRALAEAVIEADGPTKTYEEYRVVCIQSAVRLARGYLSLLDRLAAAESLTRERQAEVIRHCDQFADKVFAGRAELEAERDRYKRTLELILGWDCVNPPDPDRLADLPWLRRVVEAALKPESSHA